MKAKKGEDELRVYMGGIFVKYLLHFEIHCKDCEYSITAPLRRALEEIRLFKRHREEKHENAV